MPAVKKAPVKKAAAKATAKAPAKKVAKGDKLKCEVCGLVVLVDEVSGYMEFDELICCEQPMKAKAAAAKKAPVAKKAVVKPASKKM